MRAWSLAVLSACGVAFAQNLTVQSTSTCSSSVAAAAATALTEQPTSNVSGKAFDRIMIIYMETTSFGNATADPNCAALAKQGILLNNLHGVGAPSQPAYMAAGSGDTFGLNSDSFVLVDKNVSTIIDLLEDKNISWGNYNEGLPYTGFQGFKYELGLYERKHNLIARFDSIRLKPDRMAKMKNMTRFWVELEKQQLPQWIFITPNLFSDGHNTDVRTSCAWARGFIQMMLQDDYFNNNTLVYLTWQANGDAGGMDNHVAGVILGSAVPQNLKGTIDTNFYNHYSELSTVEANWGLHTLGRWDVGANVWEFVGNKTGDKIRQWNTSIAHDNLDMYLWNQSYGGVFNSANDTEHTYVSPNLATERNGRTVLPSIALEWANSSLVSYYSDIIELPDMFHPPPGFGIPGPLDPPQPITTPILAYPYAHPPAKTTPPCNG